MMLLLSAFQDALSALYASWLTIIAVWVFFFCLGVAVMLWNGNSRLREDNHDLRIRAITAEAALAFAQQLPTAQAKSDFLFEYRFGGGYVCAMLSDWPEFLHARIAAAVDWRS